MAKSPATTATVAPDLVPTPSRFSRGTHPPHVPYTEETDERDTVLQFASGVFGMVLFAFWGWALVDVALTDKTAFRRLNKALWFLIVLLAATIGAIAWLGFGRPRNAGFAPGAKLSVPKLFEHASGPRGPEDDTSWSSNTAPSLPGDRLVLESETDFSQWEAEFCEPDPDLDD